MQVEKLAKCTSQLREDDRAEAILPRPGWLQHSENSEFERAVAMYKGLKFNLLVECLGWLWESLRMSKKKQQSCASQVRRCRFLGVAAHDGENAAFMRVSSETLLVL